MNGAGVRVGAGVLACAGLIGFFAWRYQAAAGRGPARRHAILIDASGSAKDVCGAAVGVARRVLAETGEREEFRLDVFATGGASTAAEPTQLKQFHLPAQRRVLEGKEAARLKREGLLEELGKRCGALATTDESPVYMGLKRVVEHLGAAGCGAGADCRLYVQSDLEENVTAAVRDALRGSRRGAAALPAPLENEGIRVSICGLSESNGQRAGGGTQRSRRRGRAGDVSRADRVREVWLRLFTHPDLVTVEPFCPREEPPGGAGPH